MQIRSNAAVLSPNLILLVLASACVAGRGARVDSCCSTEQCRRNCARAAKPLNVHSMSLMQSAAVPRRIQEDIEERAEEKNTKGRQNQSEDKENMEEMEKEGQQRKLEVGSWKAKASHLILGNQSIDHSRTASGAAVAHRTGVMSLTLQNEQQAVRGRSLLETAELQLNHIVGNHSGNKTSKGLQLTSQSRVSSRGLSFDVNRIKVSAPFSSNGSRHGKWMALQQLIDLLHARFVAPASSRVLVAGVLCLAVLVCVLHLKASGAASKQQGRLEHLGVGNPSGADAPGNMLTSSLRQPSLVPSNLRRPSAGPSTPQDVPGPASVSASHQQSSPRGDIVSCLCKSHVVPPGSECVLYVPVNPDSSFHVVDRCGTLMMGVELLADDDVLQERRRVELTAMDGTLIAVCEDAPAPGNDDELQLFRSNGNYFATLVPGGTDDLQSLQGPRVAWTVRASCGSEWLFRGHFDRNAVQVTDRHGRMLALTQPTDPLEKHSNVDKLYMLRVAEMVDTSIILATLLAVHHLR